jgi:hypothetical protein
MGGGGGIIPGGIPGGGIPGGKPGGGGPPGGIIVWFKVWNKNTRIDHSVSFTSQKIGDTSTTLKRTGWHLSQDYRCTVAPRVTLYRDNHEIERPIGRRNSVF